MARRRASKKSPGRGRGRPRKSETILAGLSTGDLMEEIARRESQVGELEAQRNELLAQVEQLDADIAELGGAPKRRGRPRKKVRARTTATRKSRGRPRTTATGTRSKKKTAGRGRKRPRNTANLVDSLHAILNGKTLTVTEAADAVQKAGYKTVSPNFRVIVNQALLSNKKRFKKVARGTYTSK